MHGLMLFLMTLITGCLSTSPPQVNDTYSAAHSAAHPETQQDIEEMLRSDREPRLQDLLTERIEYSDVTQVSMGMPKKYVEMYLGSPAQVEVAGNPDYGNERWTYVNDIPTPNGYITERKYIYFENHQVVGWEIE